MEVSPKGIDVQEITFISVVNIATWLGHCKGRVTQQQYLHFLNGKFACYPCYDDLSSKR